MVAHNGDDVGYSDAQPVVKPGCKADHTMTEGRFTYELKVVDKSARELTASSLEFAAVDPTQPADGL